MCTDIKYRVCVHHTTSESKAMLQPLYTVKELNSKPAAPYMAGKMGELEETWRRSVIRVCKTREVKEIKQNNVWQGGAIRGKQKSACETKNWRERVGYPFVKSMTHFL